MATPSSRTAEAGSTKRRVDSQEDFVLGDFRQVQWDTKTGGGIDEHKNQGDGDFDRVEGVEIEGYGARDSSSGVDQSAEKTRRGAQESQRWLWRVVEQREGFGS